MKGLITKDLLGLKQVALTMGVLMVFYLFLGFMSMKDASGGMMYLSIMALVINIMVPLSCAGYDEQCGWDQFGASFPVSRGQIVLSRYIVNLLVICFTTLVVIVGDMIFAAFGGNPAGVAGYIVPIIVSLVYISIMNPIIYKFGVQKSRIIVMVVFLLPSILFFALSMLLFGREEGPSSELVDVIDKISSLSLAKMIAAEIGVAALAAIVYALSLLLSISIYRKKEL